MMHCSDNSEMSVLERQRLQLKWQQQQLNPLSYFNQNDDELSPSFLGDQGLSELVNGAMKPDPGLDFPRLLGSEFELSHALPSQILESSKKRKADNKTHQVIGQEKKMKGCAEEENKSTTTSATTGSTKNKAAKASEAAPKTDYIHVRARRGQATDSHSLAERVRREKISERMKYLQDLVPGCNKITGKAGMLDEIINYVQSLQRQVEFLSMKLAAINPRVDFDIENYLLKEIIPTMGMGASSSSSEEFNLQLLGGVSMVGNDPCMDMVLRRTTSAPLNFLDSSSNNLNQQQHITWDDELQNVYNNMEYEQGRFISHPFTGFQEQGHVKLEM